MFVLFFVFLNCLIVLSVCEILVLSKCKVRWNVVIEFLRCLSRFVVISV